MKKVISIFLVFAMLLSVVSVSAAEPVSKGLQETYIVNVTGVVDSGETVNILLKDDEGVKYINEFDVEKDGSYRAKFKYHGDIAGLELKVKQGNDDVTPSVVEAISEKEAVSYELNVVNSDKTYITAEIENYFNVTGKTYTVLLAYYGENNKLLDVYVKDEETVANDQTVYEEDYEIPEGTEKIKVFMWDSVKTMIPLVNEIEGKKNDKEIRVLAIGNSFTEDPCEYLEEIAASEGVKITVDKALIGGSTIAEHWKAWNEKSKVYENNTKTIDDFVDNNTYDFITFQQLSQFSGQYQTYIDHGADDALRYLREKQPNAEIVWQLTWAYEENSNHHAFNLYNYDQEEMHNAIVDAVTRYCEHAKDIKTDTGKPISLDGKPLRYIPTGIAFHNARQSEMFATEYDSEKCTVVSGSNNFLDETKYVGLHRDSYHASFTWGRYLAALTWYGALTGNSTLDVDFSSPSFRTTMTDAQRQVLNRAANDAVKSTGFWN